MFAFGNEEKVYIGMLNNHLVIFLYLHCFQARLTYCTKLQQTILNVMVNQEHQYKQLMMNSATIPWLAFGSYKYGLQRILRIWNWSGQKKFVTRIQFTHLMVVDSMRVSNSRKCQTGLSLRNGLVQIDPNCYLLYFLIQNYGMYFCIFCGHWWIFSQVVIVLSQCS